jgi:hypothetical protein
MLMNYLCISLCKDTEGHGGKFTHLCSIKLSMSQKSVKFEKKEYDKNYFKRQPDKYIGKATG